jgi:hypothetical protein
MDGLHRLNGSFGVLLHSTKSEAIGGWNGKWSNQSVVPESPMQDPEMQRNVWKEPLRLGQVCLKFLTLRFRVLRQRLENFDDVQEVSA